MATKKSDTVKSDAVKTDAPQTGPTSVSSGVRRVVVGVLSAAWNKDVFAHAAQAAFWQTLSLPPLFLGLLGSLGYVGDWFGPDTVRVIEAGIVDFARQIFTPDVVEQIIAPTATSILSDGRADVVSVGFVMALWSGSAAIASLVDSVSDAHNQKLVRHPLWQRAVSLLMYLFALVVAVFTLPVIALGPGTVIAVLPERWQPFLRGAVEVFSLPVAAGVMVLVLAVFYRITLPHSLPWLRLLPGALFAVLVFVACATGLRIYIAVLTGTGYTYGALATPIAFLLFAFLLGFSIVLGAYLNHAVEEVWPSGRRLPRRIKRLRTLATAYARRREDAHADTDAPPDTGTTPPDTGTPTDTAPPTDTASGPAPDDPAPDRYTPAGAPPSAGSAGSASVS